MGWLEGKKIEMRDKISELHAESVAESDILGWAEDKNEVEIMDLLLQMKQKVSELKELRKLTLRTRVILQMEHLKGKNGLALNLGKNRIVKILPQNIVF